MIENSLAAETTMPRDAVPVICIDDLANKETRRALDNACREWGFYDQELTKNIADWKEIYDYADSGEEVQICHCLVSHSKIP